MRAFVGFLALFAAAFAVVAVFTYPAWLLVIQFSDVRFHRVGSRLGMLVLAIGLVLLARRLRVGDRASLGYGLPPQRFAAELLGGLGLGFATMLPATAAILLLGLRSGMDATTATVLHALFTGLMTGLTVGFIEETFLRGAMFTAVRRESGLWFAVLGTSVLYSLTHFLGRYRIAAADAHWWSGLELIQGSLHALAQPLGVLDALVCLTVVGAILALVREQTGNIAACIGLHAGWVAVITMTRELTVIDTGHPAAGALLSTYDGVVGWLVCGWSLLMGPALWLYYRRRAQGDSAALNVSRAR